MTDLAFLQDDMFTCFFANNEKGLAAWKIIAANNEGVAKILNTHAYRVITQLQEAGYMVTEAAATTSEFDDDILSGLFRRN